ncbi:MAG: hypothetical protein ACOCTM_03805, partial [Bacteroidota bacterium]
KKMGYIPFSEYSMQLKDKNNEISALEDDINTILENPDSEKSEIIRLQNSFRRQKERVFLFGDGSELNVFM